MNRDLIKSETLAHCGSIACIPSAAHVLGCTQQLRSTRDVYNTMLLPRVASTTRCRVGVWLFKSAFPTNRRWLETHIATCCLTILPLISAEVPGLFCRTSSPIIASPPSATNELWHDAAMTRHVVASLELVDNCVESRLWETSKGSPC